MIPGPPSQKRPRESCPINWPRPRVRARAREPEELGSQKLFVVVFPFWFLHPHPVCFPENYILHSSLLCHSRIPSFCHWGHQ